MNANDILHQLLALAAIVPLNTGLIYFLFRKKYSIKSIFHAIPTAATGAVLGWLAAHFIR